MLLVDYLKEKLRSFFPDPLGTRAGETVFCPYPSCGRRMLFRDVWQHFFVQHIEIRKKFDDSDSRSENESDYCSSRSENVSRGDFVDDYSIHWDSASEEEMSVPEIDGSERKRRKIERLRSKWEPILKRLEDSGEVSISDNQHLGGLRGKDILVRFRQDVKRMDLDYGVDVDLSSGTIKKC